MPLGFFNIMIFEELRYKVPIPDMERRVAAEIGEAQLKYGRSWMGEYYYNFHLLFPYVKKGIAHHSENLANATEMGFEHTSHGQLLDEPEMVLHTRHTPLFLNISPLSLDQIRVLIAADISQSRVVVPINLPDSVVGPRIVIPEGPRSIAGYPPNAFVRSVNDYFNTVKEDFARGEYEKITKKRHAMFHDLNPYWVRFKALGFNNVDLKS